MVSLKGQDVNQVSTEDPDAHFMIQKATLFFLCRTKIIKASENKRTDRMRRGVQTRVVTNREFYELQTCRNGVALVCSGSYQRAGSRGGRELRKNGLIHFLHERVSLGQHQTSQSTQIYRPLKQRAPSPLYATIGRLLRPSLVWSPAFTPAPFHCSSLHLEHFYCLI